jgi:hypothetical protein
MRSRALLVTFLGVAASILTGVAAGVASRRVNGGRVMPATVEAPELNTGSRAPSANESDGEFVRRAYERTIDWYKVAETKAQLLFTAKWDSGNHTLRSVDWKG